MPSLGKKFRKKQQERSEKEPKKPSEPTKSQMKLFNFAGFAMLTITTKKDGGKLVPVGEEDLTAVIQTPDGFVTWR